MVVSLHVDRIRTVDEEERERSFKAACFCAFGKGSRVCVFRVHPKGEKNKSDSDSCNQRCRVETPQLAGLAWLPLCVVAFLRTIRHHTLTSPGAARRPLSSPRSTHRTPSPRRRYRPVLTPTGQPTCDSSERSPACISSPSYVIRNCCAHPPEQLKHRILLPNFLGRQAKTLPGALNDLDNTQSDSLRPASV
ncbi:tyrocidine synthetase 1 [Pseudozyma hubeiensis SY62]|uniref:Tyrocidine synthetase 1 n=1 Tax=Pseudozyma hubeiensis (strain SY62) TaxID=1305764 RepID=R9PP28_PSEHS|nr:tyrocidine synthetase 1 [Pseudozyma hubeiensis SY62]GAC99840.1 tyrocidine synthetase 1 [Pseudozyma hubeiensis SY62]